MNTGWIKLHRKLKDWEWYTDANTMRLFIHLLLTANHKDKNWHGVLIKAGSRVTSLRNLADELGIGVQSIRTSINRLKSTQEITQHKNNKFTYISINNYISYQDTNTLANNQLTHSQHTTNTQLTTNKNDKNNNNEKNTNVLVANENIFFDTPVLHTTGMTIGKPSIGKVRLGKVSIGKDIYVDFIKDFNAITGKRFRYDKANEGNLHYWLSVYSMEEIMIAVKLAHKADDWWKDKLTPVLLLRQRNKNGNCDYIGDLLNKYEGKYEINNS